MKQSLKTPGSVGELLCDHSPDAVLIIDESGKILHANPSAHCLFDESESGLQGKAFRELLRYETEWHAFLNFMQSSGDTLRLYEIEMVRKGRRSLFADVSLAALKMEGTRVAAVFIRDVTDLHVLMAKWKKGEMLLNDVFNAIEDGISLLDKDLTIVRTNAWLERMYERHLPLVGKKCYAVYQDRSAPCPWCPSLRAMEEGVRHAEVVPYPTEAAPTGWLEVFAFPMRDAKGQISGVVVYVKDITERKKLEAHLIESEEKYRLFFESLQVCTYRTTREGKVLDMNRACARLFGCPQEKLRDLDISEVYENPKDRKRFLSEIKKRGFLIDYPVRLKRLDGTSRSCRITAVQIYDRAGKVVGQQGIIQDVTEQESLQKALRESEEKYRRFFENPAICAYITAKDGKIIEVNDATVNLLGYKRGDLKKYSAIEMYADPAERDNVIRELEKKGSVENFPVHLRRKDGRILSCLLTTTVIVDGHGNITGFQGIVQDVTEREEREKEVRRLYTLLNQTDAEVMITDLNGTIEYVNTAFERITGYTAAEVRGQNSRILKSGKHDKAFYKHLWDTITGGKPWHGRFVNKRKDGTFYHEDAAIFPVFDEKGSIINYAAIKRDITREVALEEQLQQAAKLEAIGQLVGGIAHDFNNILTSIQGFTELALSKITPQDTLWNELTEIRSSAKQASRITQQLLGFSRKQMISPRPVSGNQIVREMRTLLQRYIGEDIQLMMTLTSKRDVIIADRGQIEQCLLNLVINARDAILAKGKKTRKRVVTIETDVVAIGDKYLESHIGLEKGDYFVISVSDTGIGMDKETLRKIFDPFFTTKPEGKGTGLGCSTVFGIVKQNRGVVHAYSEPGVGTTIKIYWPLAAKGTVVEKKEDESAQVPMFGQETILIVEDDASIRRLVKQALEMAGYRVFEAESGAQALKLFKEKELSVDLLFTDIIMTGMTGDELAKILQKKMPSLKVLFSSGYTENHIFQNGILKPGKNFLHKPYAIRDLLRKIREVLDRDEGEGPSPKT